ncbi:hypothetical protein CEXT_763231 [Caerostris extrusa]|uniref:C2H2-type domain-containing protein n=1 Tax=Caerostris extrusa TaxID=172846 RepID=A0AAV4MS72_CAEEX|nr:hypothetical protein CEXT_763231 [Caerostris extrusa]
MSATSTIPENDSHLCGECLDWFPHFNDILLHTNEHKEKYVHRCTECPFVFSSRAQLYQHHHEKLPYNYECNGCGIKFKEKSIESCTTKIPISVQSFGVENHEACDSNLVLKDSSIKSSIDICRIETTNAEIETDFVGFPVNSEKESIFRSCNSDSLNKVSQQDSPLVDLNLCTTDNSENMPQLQIIDDIFPSVMINPLPSNQLNCGKPNLSKIPKSAHACDTESQKTSDAIINDISPSVMINPLPSNQLNCGKPNLSKIPKSAHACDTESQKTSDPVSSNPNLVLKDDILIKSSTESHRINIANTEAGTDVVDSFCANSEKESIFRSCNSDSLNKVSEQDSPLVDLNLCTTDNSENMLQLQIIDDISPSVMINPLPSNQLNCGKPNLSKIPKSAHACDTESQKTSDPKSSNLNLVLIKSSTESYKIKTANVETRTDVVDSFCANSEKKVFLDFAIVIP